MPTIKLDSLSRAVMSLEQIMAQPLDNSMQSEFIRDGAIQRFEYTYELSWKILRRVLETHFEAKEPLTARDVFREAARRGLLEDVADWFSYHEARNQIAHIYSEDLAVQVYQAGRDFLPNAQKLLVRLIEICS